MLFKYDETRFREQVAELGQLDRLAACVRQGYSIHPSLFERTYTSMEDYLYQHLSPSDWQCWLSITVGAEDEQTLQTA